jgi:predicted PurR-regulated permease PerM
MAERRKNRKMSRVKRTQNTPVRDIGWDSVFASFGRIEVVLLAGSVLLLLVLFYTIHSILSPFLALGAILFILFPLRRHALARNVMWLAIVLFALWFLDSVSTILAPFIVSLVFAYMLDPVVDLFQKWKIPRWISSLVIILLFLAGITLILFFIIPIAFRQFEGAMETLSKVTYEYQNAFWSSKLIKLLESYGVSIDELRASVASQLTPRFEDIIKTVVNLLGQLMSSITGFLTQIFYIILIPFLTFYFLTDFPKISHRFKLLFPRKMRDRVEEYMSRADDLIGHYLRGALLVALLQGIIIGVVFSIAGIKYAFLLGLLAGIFDLVPYFGLFAIMVLSAVIALFSDPPVLMKLSIAVASISLLHMAEVTFLSPKIIGSKVGLHPLMIILSLLVFMYFLGFVGLLIAVPTTALIILFVRDWEARRRGVIFHPGNYRKSTL